MISWPFPIGLVFQLAFLVAIPVVFVSFVVSVIRAMRAQRDANLSSGVTGALNRKA